MGRGAANSIKFGKVELVSTDEGTTMDSLMKHLNELLDKHGYPEADPEEDGEKKGDDGGEGEEELVSGTEEMGEEEMEELIEREEEEVQSPEKPKPIAPWERVKLQRGGEDPNSQQ